MGGRGVNYNSPTSPVRVRARERDLEALALRARGLTFSEIGQRLGVAKQSAHDAVRRALAIRAEQIQENADELRAIEAEKLDRAAEAVWALVEAGDLQAQSVWIRNRDRFAVLLGLNLRREPEGETGARWVVIDTRLPSERGPVIEGEVVEGESIEADACSPPSTDDLPCV